MSHRPPGAVVQKEETGGRENCGVEERLTQRAAGAAEPGPEQGREGAVLAVLSEARGQAPAGVPLTSPKGLLTLG